jgi:peptide methionine sulfoxide reductase msrA/msrB
MYNLNMNEKLKRTIFAGGCFWCTEAAWHSGPGVTDVVSGFAGDLPEIDPDKLYMKIAHKELDAREANLVTYNVGKSSFEELVRYFFSIIDPLDDGGQFHDRGFSYTTAIYVNGEEERIIAEKVIAELNASGKYKSVIATKVVNNEKFIPASEYHQNYKDKNEAHYEGYYKGSGREDFFKK